MVSADKFTNLKEGVKRLEEAYRLMSSGPATFYIDELLGAYDYMMERFSPFHIGDIVELSITPNIPEGSGWYGSRHFLIKGSPGTVMSAECSKDGFVYLIEFDCETWVDSEGKRQPVANRALYSFGEKSLRYVAYTTEHKEKAANG